MPTFVHGKSSKVYLDEFEMSGYLNSTDVSYDQDTAETTVYGATSRAYIPSQASGTPPPHTFRRVHGRCRTR